MRDQLDEASALATPAPTLGLDLDGCIDECTVFFRTLSRCWPGRVVVITFRSDRAKAIADLGRFGVRYDDLVLVDSFDAKAKVIEQYGVLTYFDDQPEMLRDVSPMVNVMLVRNGGNYDFDDRRWVLSAKTGKLI